MAPSPDPEAAAAARARAHALVAETMAEIIAFWGFKASTGRIWSLLFLSPEPLPADVIEARTGLSAGAVSMGLAELLQWGIVERAAPRPGTGENARKKLYTAETDVWGVVRRVIRERELRLVGRAVQRFTEAAAALEATREDPETAFMLGRIQGLLSLTSIGYRLVESFATSGMFTLDPIRGALHGLGLGSGSSNDPDHRAPGGRSDGQ
jgi:HTH-type transcriptional regulator, glycine betaine synthesis regulator